jgi:hypothetical protein
MQLWAGHAACRAFTVCARLRDLAVRVKPGYNTFGVFDESSESI